MKQFKKFEDFFVSILIENEVTLDDIIDKITIKNPATNKKIKLSSALEYDENEPVYKIAKKKYEKIKSKIKDKIEDNDEDMSKIASKEEYSAVKDYENGFTVGDVQRFLRGQKFLSGKGDAYKKEMEDAAKNISNSIQKYGTSLKKGTTIYRGVDDASIYGKEKVDKGFTSVAKDLNNTVKVFGLGGIIMKIIIDDDDIKGLDMNKFLKKSDTDGEEQDEILLQNDIKYELIDDGDEIKTYRAVKNK